MRLKRWQKCLLIVLALLGYGYYKLLFSMGEFMNPVGTILVPLKNTEGAGSVGDGVYSVALADRPAEKRLFFRASGWGGYDFPWVQDKKFFCVGYRYTDVGWQHRSRLYMVESIRRANNVGTVLMETSGMILHPALTKDLQTVYYHKEDDRLYSFDRRDGSERQLEDDKISKNTQLLVTDDGGVIYRAERDYALIKRMPDGTKEVLLQDAWNPMWYERGKSILYVSIDDNLSSVRRVYQLADKRSVAISDYTYSAGAMSPDRQYLAYTASGYWDAVDSVSLVSMDGREKRGVGHFPWESTNGRLYWMDEADFVEE